MADLRDFTGKNRKFTGTKGILTPKGTTDQRASTESGDIRFNTTNGLMEYFDGASYRVIDSPPTIISVSPTEVDTTAGGNITFTITGSNFNSGAIITFIANDSTDFNASTTTVNSVSSISAVVARSSFLNAKEPYDVKVLNTSGLSGLLSDQINVDSSPTWTTTAGNLTTITDAATGTHATVVAADAESDTITYSETGGTVLTTAGLTLNSSTGVISGDPTDVASSTTYSFDLRATANSKTADRTFNIIVNPNPDGTTSARAASSVDTIVASGATTDGLKYYNVGGSTVQALTLLNSGTSGVMDGSGWVLAYNLNVNDAYMTGSLSGPGVNDFYGRSLWTNSTNNLFNGSAYNLTSTCIAPGAFMNCSKIMIMYHTGNFAAPVRTCYYTKASGVTLQSLRTWFNNNTRDQVWSTGGRQGIYTGGSFTAATFNGARPSQAFTGDPFAENGNSRGNNTSYSLASFNLVLNSSVAVYGSGASDYNDCRFTTTMCADSLSGNDYGHTVQHGIGVRHEHSGYGASTAISLGQSSYCAMERSHQAGNGSGTIDWGSPAFAAGCISGASSNSSVTGVAIFIK
jgi:hypothetical protein